jgi:hypothetical protein
VKRIRFVLLFILAIALLEHGTPTPHKAWPQYLGPIGSWPPPMQSQAPVPTTGRVGGYASSPFVPPAVNYRSQINRQFESQYVPPLISGRQMANIAITRGVLTGLRF